MAATGLVLVGLVVLAGFGAFGLLSLREGEGRAARVALAVAVVGALTFFLATLLPAHAQRIVLLAVVVELSIATKGLGAMLWLSWETLRVERIYVAIAVIAVIALIFNPILELTRRRLTPWQQAH